MTAVYGSSPSGDEVINDISDAIGKMDAKKLSDYFSSTIDLEMNEINGSYSKAQAEVILSDFFKNNPVLSFTVNHKGDSDDGSKYFIGTYKTNARNYRIYGLLKKESDKLVIRQLQFDLE
jgi:hypothetical protein